MRPNKRELSTVENKTVRLSDRSGAPVFIDFFSNKEGNFNVTIPGVPGSGKTVLMKHIMKSYLSVGAKGWIIDIGRSYEDFVVANGGQLIKFRRDMPICINPFSWVSSIVEDMWLLVPWVARMAQAQGPYAMSLIERAVGDCYKEHRELTTITDVQKYLMENCLASDNKIDEEAYRLGIQMAPFCKGGIYADFFNGQTTFSINADLIVIELEDLRSEPELLKAMIFVLMNRITHEMYLSRDAKKIVILDEILSYFAFEQSAQSADFIETCYRRARAYDGSFITGTQGLGDCFQNPSDCKVYAFSDWKIYARQDADTLKILKQKGQLNLEPSLELMIASLGTESGKFSEFVVRSPLESGLVRLSIEPSQIESTAFTTFDFNPFNITDNFNETMTDVAASEMSFTAPYLKEMEAKHATKSN